MRSIRAAPCASMLIASMRDLGYSLETALADVIDNSIAAGASTIDICAEIGQPPRIAVVDDGHGMSHDALMTAMRLGSRNPLSDRPAADLGRFGLGLKTASFSQCRRLTVATRTAHGTHAALWDLQHVADRDDWLVQLPDNIAAIPFANSLGNTGTLVLWEDLDRLVEVDSSGPCLRHLVTRLDDARSHLELVFHRFLSGEPGYRKITIRLNGRPLEARDPFNSRHPATVIGPLETIHVGGHAVHIQAFTLPHHRKVSTQEWERDAGREGYLKNQGFYVYRERRLIIYGTWFGLARQAELTKLSRVRIDMPNGLDEEWKIDVKKASAQPPLVVRERLRKILTTIGADSIRVYTTRGRRRTDDSRLPAWTRVQDGAQLRYQTNRDHPVIAAFLSRLEHGLHREFARVLDFVESTLPIDMLFADMGAAPDRVATHAINDAALRHAVYTTAARLRAAGVSANAVATMLQQAEPFASNWERTEAVLDDLRNQEHH